MKRREFLLKAAGFAVMLSVPVFAKAASNKPLKATAITQVFGDGINLTGVAIEYKSPLEASSINAKSFSVAGHKISKIYLSDAVDGAPKDSGKFVTLKLERTNLLVKKPPKQNQDQSKGPGKAGDKQENSPKYTVPRLTIDTKNAVITSSAVKNLIIDDFKQLEFKDNKTGQTLRYNLFVPKNYDKAKSYPLVLFMHDAEVTGTNTIATLIQGNGATSWAGAEIQAKHLCFVLAPQFDEIVADDDSQVSGSLDTTINLINELAGVYSIDKDRLYTTGQSGGGMLSIAMDIKFPNFFAASYLVACQWDEKLVAPMAKQNLFIVVSQDDTKAYPGQTAIVNELQANGAKVARGVWDAKWSAQESKEAFEKLISEGANVNFVSFKKGSVLADGQTNSGAGHVNTWKFAYDLTPVLEWILTRKKPL